MERPANGAFNGLTIRHSKRRSKKVACSIVFFRAIRLDNQSYDNNALVRLSTPWPKKDAEFSGDIAKPPFNQFRLSCRWGIKSGQAFREQISVSMKVKHILKDLTADFSSPTEEFFSSTAPAPGTGKPPSQI